MSIAIQPEKDANAQSDKYSLLIALGPLAISVILTLIVYGASLSYGFMYDDPLDLPRATGRSYLSILTSAGESKYYRPIVLLIWKAMHDLLGRNDPVVLHALVLIVHALNGWLVYLLGEKLQGKVGGYIAAGLFVLFPLSYQAVGKINVFFHPLVTMFLLISIVCYWTWRERNKRVLLGCSLLSGVLAVLTHEYGVSLFILIAAVEVYFAVQKQQKRLSSAPMLFAAISLGFLLFWQAIPRYKQSWALDLASIKMNSLYFFQGLLYPVTQHLGQWVSEDGVSITQILLICGLPMLMILVVGHLFSHKILAFVFSLGLVSVCTFPAVIFLSQNYVIDGPRLLYLASVGISLVWSGFLSAPFRMKSVPMKTVLGAIFGLLALSIIRQSLVFIQARIPVYEAGASVVRRLVETSADSAHPGRTYVNLPSWFAPKGNDYPLGHTGITMIPEYVGLGRVVYVQTGQQPKISSLAYDVTKKEMNYFYGPHGKSVGLAELEQAFRKGGGVYTTHFNSDSVDLDYVGSILPPNSLVTEGRYIANIGNWGRIVSVEAQLWKQIVSVSIEWESLKKVDRDITVFVHVYDENGKLLGQTDGYPIGQMFPPVSWLPGDLIEDRRIVALPANCPLGTYTVLVGAYDRSSASAQREPATDSTGERFRDDAVTVGNIPVTAP